MLPHILILNELIDTGKIAARSRLRPAQSPQPGIQRHGHLFQQKEYQVYHQQRLGKWQRPRGDEENAPTGTVPRPQRIHHPGTYQRPLCGRRLHIPRIRTGGQPSI